MRVIPVLDLRGGRAVHARGGARDAYAPVASRLCEAAGDAVALARAYRDALGIGELYVADLDAIAGGAPQRALVRALAGEGSALWLDGGIADAEAAARAVEDGASRVVVGLETLRGFGDLAAIVRAAGARRVIFSLDLRAGVPVVAPNAEPLRTPVEAAERAVAAGAVALLVLDLARVGSGAGVDDALARALRRRFPEVELAVGGGVSGAPELARLADAGCDAVLVGSALHDGRLGPRELAAHASRSRGPASASRVR